MKIKIMKTGYETFETEGHRIQITLLNGSEITLVEPLLDKDILHVNVDGGLIIHPNASNACDLSVEK